MRIDVDPKAPTPPSEQIADQVRFAVAGGRLSPGDKLPSVRRLASEALVNPNTVARAYRELSSRTAWDQRVPRAVGTPVGTRAQEDPKRPVLGTRTSPRSLRFGDLRRSTLRNWGSHVRVMRIAPSHKLIVCQWRT